MKPPALVLAAVPRMATTISRSLHRHGIPVDVATFSAMEPRIPSNSIRHFFRVPDPDVSQQDFATVLTELIQQYHHDVLIPGNDVALTAIVENYERLQPFIKLACPPPPIVQRVLDKDKTLAIASDCGLPIPKTVLLSNTRQLPELARHVGLPCVIKPGQKQRTEDFKTRVIRDLREIPIFFPEPLEFSPPMLLQEYCSGVGVGIEMLVHEGRCLTAFQHRRIKEYPYGGGVAVLAVAEALNPTLVKLSTQLLQALGWEGLAMVEFRVDPDSGRAVLMEVNGRIWGSISLPVSAGVDFPFFVWQIMHKETPHIPQEYAVGMRWRWTAGYVQRFNGVVMAKLKGRFSGSLAPEFVDFASDFGRGTTDSLWDMRDPLPAAYELLTTVGDLLVFNLKALANECRRRCLPRRWLTDGSLEKTAGPILQEGVDGQNSSRN